MAHHYEAVENRIDDRIHRVAVGYIIIGKQSFYLLALEQPRFPERLLPGAVIQAVAAGISNNHPEYSKLHYAETVMKSAYDWPDNVAGHGIEIAIYSQCLRLSYTETRFTDDATQRVKVQGGEWLR